MRKEIFITGYPRSGNTWMNRMLCDLFNAPLQNLPNNPCIWEYTQTRGDEYIVRKTHWYRWQYNDVKATKGYLGNDCKMIWVYRDPRDMAVSVMYFRQGTEIAPIIIAIDNPGSPGVGIHSMVKGWLGECDHSQSYEHLSMHTTDALRQIYRVVTGEDATVAEVDRVANRHTFLKWAPKYPGSMRKGIVGDWKNHFTRADAEMFAEKYQDLLELLNYESDDSWVSKV